jgi:pyridoxal-phosphate dependent TrpB-like enzyme
MYHPRTVKESDMSIGITDSQPLARTAAAPGFREVPARWCNILTRLPEPVPPALDAPCLPAEPAAGAGGGPADRRSALELLAAIRLRAMLEQDASRAPWIDIPGEVRERYAEMGRPTPLMRARALEKHLATDARIFIKREDLLPTGSFKLNSALAQCYFARAEGAPGLVTETGAGQWGQAVAHACRLYGLRSVVFWAKVSERQKQGRSALTRMLGAEVHPSPSGETAVGRRLLGDGGDPLGSLGSAIGEAICYARDHGDCKYVSGSNLPHVLLHQTVIGLETRAQLAHAGVRADVLIACVGGGSNLGGFMGPFLEEKQQRGAELRLIAAEAATAPRLTRGELRYDHADPLGITPLTKSYTLGRDYRLPATHVGGLRQHNGSPVVGVLRKCGLLEAVAYEEAEIFAAGALFVRLEGVLPAPESCHALRAAIDVARELQGQRKNIVLCLSGSGWLDLEGYRQSLGL